MNSRRKKIVVSIFFPQDSLWFGMISGLPVIQEFLRSIHTNRLIITDSRAEHAKFRGVVAGRNRPAVVGGGRAEAAGDRRGVQLLPRSGGATSKILSANSLERGTSQKVLDDLSNSGPAVRRYREGRATGPPEDRSRRRHDAIFGCYSTPRRLRRVP